MSTPEAADFDLVFRILGKQGSLEILTQASDEFISGKEAIRSTGLTQKLYYSRLSELRRLGLVRREGIRSYRITERGRLVLDLQDRLTRAISQNRASLPVESRVITNYAEMVGTLSAKIDGSRARIKLASRYVDPIIAKSTFDAFDRNVSVQAILKSDKAHLGRLGLDALALLDRGAMVQAVRMARQTRIADIPFSFAVVDGQWSGIELVGPDETFLAALEFEGGATATALSILFRHYYRIGTVFPRFW